MEIKLVERDTFFMCGYAVETTSDQNDNDISALYSDFFSSGKESVLKNLKGSQKGYYGLSWYTQGHRQYYYMLGMEVGQDNTVPPNAVIKKVPKTTYARAHFRQGEDIIKAWTEFFYNEIPKAGFAVNEEHNLYFEYYPDSVNGQYELWVPVVVKANV